MNNQEPIISGYKITESNEVNNKLYAITPEIQEKLAEMGVKVQKKKNSAIKELNDLIKKHPTVPHFKNYLSVLYDAQGNHFMAREVNSRIVSQHPTYLFGKLNLANIAIANKEYEKVPEILGKDMELQALYPERNEFHFGEVIGFLQTAFNYFIGIEDVEQAQVRLDIIEKLNKEFDLGLNIFDFEKRIMGINLEKGLIRQKMEWALQRKPDLKVKKVVEPNTEAPQFTHHIINQLYCNSLKIDPQIIAEILTLPRETLLADLHKVVYDSMARFEIFSEMDWDNQKHEFLMHALLLLTELKDERSVEVVLDVLRQDSEYLDIWFADFLTDGFWELLYVIANDKLDQMYNFVIEPNGYTYSKSSVSQMVEQIAYHQPERIDEVVDWYKRILQFWIENQDNENIIDTELIAFYISDIVNIQLTELKPEIKTLFHLNLVAKGVSGDLESCLEDIDGYSTINRKIELFSSITERYNYFTTHWLSYEDNTNDFENDNNDEIQDAIYEEVKKIVPLPGEKPKVGRNEPCPCGSGKKFKKCCGK